MSKLALYIIFQVLLNIAYAQNTPFNLSENTIADDLRKDANFVYRLDETTLEIISPSRYIEKKHQIVTILNEEGNHHLSQKFWFDKFNKIDHIEINVFDGKGIIVKKYKKKDFSIQSYYDGISLVTDDQLMHLQLSHPEYPFTIELSYERTCHSYIGFFPNVLDTHNGSIEQFLYTVKVPSELDIRYHSTNLGIHPSVTENRKQKIYTWKLQNQFAKKIEDGGYEAYSYLPRIEVAPNVFEYDGYKGFFRNWNDFGKWCYALYENNIPFSKQRIEEIKSLVNGLVNVKDKVQTLYSYLQKNTRYVSIQLGIGGYKPFSCLSVDEKKYGDCKALTNYMYNLLAVVGIRSYPALINAGYDSPPVNAEFPANKFNHVILCVPDGQDTIWLECTSNINKAGFLGNFTENKYALLLTESGGVLVKTPTSDYNNNHLVTTNTIQLNEEGGAIVKSKIKASGDFYSLLFGIKQMDPIMHKELITKYFQYKEADYFSEDSLSQAHEISFTSEYLKLFDFKAGAKLFLPASVCKINSEVLSEANRSIEYLFEFPYKKVDTTIYYLPPSYAQVNLPKNVSLDNEFVQYKREVFSDGAILKLVSTLILKKHIVPPSSYKLVTETFKQIKNEDSFKLIFEKRPIKEEQGKII